MQQRLPLYSPLVTAQDVKEIDSKTVEQFLYPEALLMENASRELLHVLTEKIAITQQQKILLIAGSGNNGGDAIALARQLHALNFAVLLCHTAPLEKSSKTAKEHIIMAQKTGVPFCKLESSIANCIASVGWSKADLIIDALCGVGLVGELRQREKELIEEINNLRETSYVLAVDIPSGLSAISGEAQPIAVHAHCTVSFQYSKPAFYAATAKHYIGELYIRSIGIPPQAFPSPSWLLLEPQKGAWAVPSALLHKGSAGKVLVIGGSNEYCGAPFLSALAALRSGAGMVHIACPQKLVATIRNMQAEFIMHGIGESDVWQKEVVHELKTLIQKIQVQSIVLGPGIGRSQEVKDIIKAIVNLEHRPPLVIDADALHFFTLANTDTESDKIPLHLLNESDIITPHPKEFMSLFSPVFWQEELKKEKDLGKEMGEIFCTQRNNKTKTTSLDEKDAVALLQKKRNMYLQIAATLMKGIIVLKGPLTLIKQQKTPIILSPFSLSSLAIAGSGDVLAGCIAASLAKGFTSIDAAALAVYLHGRAGERLYSKSPLGHLASEIAKELPFVWKELGEGTQDV